MTFSIDKSLDYQIHQRDYSILGSSVVFRGFYNENKSFFHYAPYPVYLVIKDDIFYHIMSKKDGKNRCQNWLKNNDINSLIKTEKEYDQKLKEFNEFMEQDYDDLENSIRQLNKYFIDFTNIIFIGYEAPEYCKDDISNELNDLLFMIRRKYEDVHKRCFIAENKILSKMEKKYSIENDLFFYLTISEFEEFLQTKKMLNIDFNQRKKFCIIEYSEEGESIYSDRALWQQFEQEAGDEIKGQIAYIGKAKGKVRIIRKIKDSVDLKEGEILVASMTDPRYLPAMKKAAAFVTDEGGITCHAAIVARELKKPCVIGTKVATRLLKDGDEVEVDAEKGIITLIK